MGYVDKNLMTGEKIVHRAKLHWVRYGWACFWLVLSLFAKEEGRWPFVLVGVTLAVLAFLDVFSSEFVVTNKRVYLKQGILRRRSIELLLSKIESMQVEQGILGRIMGYGSIAPGGSGGTKQAFKAVAKPLAFRQRVNEQIDAAR